MAMRREFKWLSVSFILAILLHLFVLFALTVRLTLFVKNDNKVPLPENHFVPAYVMSSAAVPPVMAAKPVITHTKMEPDRNPNQKPDVAKIKSIFSTPNPWVSGNMVTQSSFTSSNESEELTPSQMRAAIKHAKQLDPMLLVGEVSNMADPFITLLGHALSAHFNYPKMEGSFGIRGKVLVEMILHPDGKFTNVRVIQSSENQDFDSAALMAVNAAPIIDGADRFISEPKYMVIGFIFD